MKMGRRMKMGMKIGMDGLELGMARPMGHTSGQDPSPSSASLAWVSVRPWASSC